MNKIMVIVITWIVIISGFASVLYISNDTNNKNGNNHNNTPYYIKNGTGPAGAAGFYPAGMPLSQKSSLHNFAMFSYNRYGMNMSSNALDHLQYTSDLNFMRWYESNYYFISPGHRGITRANASALIGMRERSSQSAKRSVNAVVQYEMNQHSTKNKINAMSIAEHRKGTLVSEKTISYDNHTADMLTYRYSHNNQTIMYNLVRYNGKFILTDPTFRLNSFTIHWGWDGIISGTSYNLYLNFYNYNSANAFKNFVWGALTLTAIISDIIDAAFWIIVGAATAGASVVAGVLLGIVTGVGGDLLGTTPPNQIYNNVNTLFKNEWGYSGNFRLVFTANLWEGGLLPEFAVWGRINPGNSLYEVFQSFQYLTAHEADSFVTGYYNVLTKEYGTNKYNYIGSPSVWENWLNNY